MRTLPNVCSTVVPRSYIEIEDFVWFNNGPLLNFARHNQTTNPKVVVVNESVHRYTLLHEQLQNVQHDAQQN